MAEDLEQTIRDNAAGPKRAQGDSGSVEQHRRADQLSSADRGPEPDRRDEWRRCQRGLGNRRILTRETKA